MTLIPGEAQARLWQSVTGAKFIITFQCITGAFIGLAWGWLTGAEFVTVVGLVMTVFVAGNWANNRDALKSGALSESRE